MSDFFMGASFGLKWPPHFVWKNWLDKIERMISGKFVLNLTFLPKLGLNGLRGGLLTLGSSSFQAFPPSGRAVA
jgi:hypothetical protein